MSEDSSPSGKPAFAIFRAKDAKPDTEVGLMHYEDSPPVVVEGLQRVQEAGFDHGHDLKVLFSAPGFSLLYIWFKSEFPLPRHSHDADCLYYIVGGSVRLGREELGVGDGFFVARDTAYSYVPGPEGVELLEFRTADSFNFRNLATGQAFLDTALETVRKQRDAWLTETRPTSAQR